MVRRTFLDEHYWRCLEQRICFQNSEAVVVVVVVVVGAAVAVVVCDRRGVENVEVENQQGWQEEDLNRAVEVVVVVVVETETESLQAGPLQEGVQGVAPGDASLAEVSFPHSSCHLSGCGRWTSVCWIFQRERPGGSCDGEEGRWWSHRQRKMLDRLTRL